MAKIKAGKDSSKKEVIIQKAAFLFKAKGFAATSMRELADELGVEAPSLYNHISSKSELLQAICLQVADAFTVSLDISDREPAGTIDRLQLIIKSHIRMMTENFNEVFVANHEWKQLQEPFLSQFLNKRRSYEKRMVNLIEQGMRDGVFKNSNPYVAALTILSAVRGLEFWQQHKKNISSEVLEEEMVNHLLTGIIK